MIHMPKPFDGVSNKHPVILFNVIIYSVTEFQWNYTFVYLKKSARLKINSKPSYKNADHLRLLWVDKVFLRGRGRPAVFPAVPDTPESSKVFKTQFITWRSKMKKFIFPKIQGDILNLRELNSVRIRTCAVLVLRPSGLGVKYRLMASTRPPVSFDPEIDLRLSPIKNGESTELFSTRPETPFLAPGRRPFFRTSRCSGQLINLLFFEIFWSLTHLKWTPLSQYSQQAPPAGGESPVISSPHSRQVLHSRHCQA